MSAGIKRWLKGIMVAEELSKNEATMTRYVLSRDTKILFERADIAYKLLNLVNSEWLTVDIAFEITDIIRN